MFVPLLAQIKGYATVAIIVGILAGVGGVYLKGRTDAAHKAEIKDLKAQVSEQIALRQAQSKHIANVNKAARESARQALRDAAKISDLKKQAEEIANAERENTCVCVGANNSDRLRRWFQSGEDYLSEALPSGDSE